MRESGGFSTGVDGELLWLSNSERNRRWFAEGYESSCKIIRVVRKGGQTCHHLRHHQAHSAALLLRHQAGHHEA